MTQLQVRLHDKQREVFDDPHRFRIVAAGRRFGKSRLAAWMLLIEALQSDAKDIFYVAPTFQQAKDIMWGVLKDLGKDVIQSAHENTSVLTLVNGRKIHLKGADRPDTLRGVGLAFLVIDEYADIKPNVWEQILRPALADVQGKALFIGTPKGRNHFYDLWQYAEKEDDKDWESFHYSSYDNPLIPESEIEAAKKSMSSFAFRQEFLASFEAASRDIFKEEWLQYGEAEEEPQEGKYYIAVDLAGFVSVDKTAGNKNRKLDETSISIVKVHSEGWWVSEIRHGRWDIHETCNEIFNAVKEYMPAKIGIEKGSLKNACGPYLNDLMKQNSMYFRIEDLNHGNRRKSERIIWSLQAIFEKGQVTLQKGAWNKEFADQLINFPNAQMHDDLVDSLAYIQQIAQTEVIFDEDIEEEYQSLDPVSGY